MSGVRAMQHAMRKQDHVGVWLSTLKNDQYIVWSIVMIVSGYGLNEV